MSALTADAVTKIVRKCLFTEAETANGTPLDVIIAKGVVLQLGFHPGRIAQNKRAIAALLAELPEQFHKDTGGGWTFLNACMTKDGTQWGEQRNVDELICLGLATDLVKFQLPREIWSALPGGVPYFVVLP